MWRDIMTIERTPNISFNLQENIVIGSHCKMIETFVYPLYNLQFSNI